MHGLARQQSCRHTVRAGKASSSHAGTLFHPISLGSPPSARRNGQIICPPPTAFMFVCCVLLRAKWVSGVQPSNKGHVGTDLHCGEELAATTRGPPAGEEILIRVATAMHCQCIPTRKGRTFCRLSSLTKTLRMPRHARTTNEGWSSTAVAAARKRNLSSKR